MSQPREISQRHDEVVPEYPEGGYALNVVDGRASLYIYGTWLARKNGPPMIDDKYINEYFLKRKINNINMHIVARVVHKMEKDIKSKKIKEPDFTKGNPLPSGLNIWWNERNLDYLEAIAKDELISKFDGRWERAIELRFKDLGVNKSMLVQKLSSLLRGDSKPQPDQQVNKDKIAVWEKPEKKISRVHGLKTIAWEDEDGKDDDDNNNFALAYYTYRTEKTSRYDKEAEKEIFLHRHGFQDDLDSIYRKGESLVSEKKGRKIEDINLKSGPPGKYIMNLGDRKFQGFLYKLSDRNPGAYIEDLVEKYMPGCANDPANLHELGLQVWKNTRTSGGEFPLKLKKKHASKTNTNTIKPSSDKKGRSDDKTQSSTTKTQASSSRTKPSSDRETSQGTDTRDNRGQNQVNPPQATNSSHPKQSSADPTREKGKPRGWSHIDNPAPEQPRRSSSRSNESESRRGTSLAIRSSPSSSVDDYNKHPRSRRELDNDRQNGPPRTATSNSAGKRPARSLERKDDSKRTRDRIDPLRR
ncbi:hypothetical protein BGAL_0543g00020 [Botrytis galanthina]|uniref:Uncharacterized protein n=1 Tax=Botrytis galanthina TaxID=278940 RepID=A0A4S8QK10_9HELO|nr:hypothetical protein BGAL_0543g00020 [Botrytis galanthina]